MAFSPIAFVSINYRDFKNYWAKPYEPGTPTPKPFALESDGGTQVAKLEINKDGFLESAGGALVIPYIDGAYDIWLFPNPIDADNDDTSSALRIADDITGVNGAILATSVVTKFAVLNDPVISTDTILMFDGAALNIKERTTSNGGSAMWDVVLASTVTPNTFNIVICTGVATLALVLRIKNKKVSAEEIGMTNVGDSSAAIQAMFDIGVSIKGVNEYNIDTIIATSSNNIGLLGGKYNIGALAVGGTAIRVFGNDCKFKGVEFDGGDNELAQVIRTEKDAKNPQIINCKFKNFYSTGWLWIVRIETDNGGSFLCENLEFENITCLTNSTIGDTNGSVRCIRTNTEDAGSLNPTGGTINNIIMRNVNTVASKGGAPVLEDADGLQIGGRNDNPVTVNNITGYDIGKRIVKVQTRKVKVSNITCFADQTLAHEAVLEFFDGDLTFNNIQGYGNIKAVVASGTQDHSGTVGTGVVLESTYTAVSPVSQPGAIDIKGGSDIDISGIEVTGGVNGLRVTIEGAGVPINDVKIEGNFDVSGYGCLVRNINNAEGITNLDFSNSKFKSNSTDVRNVSFETTGGRLIKTVKMFGMTFNYSGTLFENVKADAVDDIMISGTFNTATQAIPLRVTNADDVDITAINEQVTGRTVAVVSVALCDRVNVAGVKSNFAATGANGMVTFEGVNMGYVSTAIPASPAATAVAFKDSGVTLCTNCVNQTVNATVFKQGGYTDANAIDINDKLNP